MNMTLGKSAPIPTDPVERTQAQRAEQRSLHQQWTPGATFESDEVRVVQGQRRLDVRLAVQRATAEEQNSRPLTDRVCRALEHIQTTRGFKFKTDAGRTAFLGDEEWHSDRVFCGMLTFSEDLTGKNISGLQPSIDAAVAEVFGIDRDHDDFAALSQAITDMVQAAQIVRTNADAALRDLPSSRTVASWFDHQAGLRDHPRHGGGEQG